MNLGNRLLEERVRQGYSLQQVENDTKIRQFYIEALEREEFWNLPPKVYAVGFVKRYAKYLGLNEDEIAAEFKQLAYSEENHSDSETKDTQRGPNSTRFRIPAKNILVALVFLVVAIWLGDFIIGYFINYEHRDLPGQIPPATEKPVSQEEEPAEPEPETAVLAKVIIEAHENCWLSVDVDGSKEYEGTLRAGDSREFEGEEMIHVRAGNSAGITVTYNGEEVESLGPNRFVNELDFPAAPVPIVINDERLMIND